jgi:hypothetical protein
MTTEFLHPHAFAGYQTGPGEGSVADAMSEPLRLTIVEKR